MIPYGRQHIDSADIEAVVAVLRSEFLTQGECVPEFEAAVCKRVSARHAVATSSATAALHLACLALGVGRGDLVWTSPVTFVASANCALYCGAEIDFVDIDISTGNLCPEHLERKLATASRNGRLPKVLVAVHLAGLPCDMLRIHSMCRKHGVAIVEDASHAIGARIEGAAVGSGGWADVTVFSFHPVKLITTGEGGMAVTNDSDLARRMRLLRSHGITRDPTEMTHPPDGPWYYQQIALGYNYRLTDLQAALGRSQLQRLDEFLSTRSAIADRYDRELGDLPLQLPTRPAGRESAWHLYVIRVNAEHSPRGRGEVFGDLRKAGIGVNVHYIPVHTQPYFQTLGFKPGMFPAAERYYRQAISLPIFPTLDHEQQSIVVDVIRKALSR